MVICLRWPLPATSSSLPAAVPSSSRTRARGGPHLAAYLALLRLGVTVPPLLPATRWALTPPFHPYPPPLSGTAGGLLSVALSVAFRRPGVTWQSALWSSDFPRCGLATAPRPSRSASVHKSNRENGLRLPGAEPVRVARADRPGRETARSTTAQASPRRARPCSAWRMNGLSAESAAFHWARTSRYSCRASARRPSCS